MEQSQLPKELRNLTPDQLQAAINFAKAKEGSQAKQETVKVPVKSFDVIPAGQTKTDAKANGGASLTEKLNSLPEGYVDPKIISAAAVLEGKDLHQLLSSDAKVQNPARLLEDVLNLVQKNSGQDTAYKA